MSKREENGGKKRRPNTQSFSGSPREKTIALYRRERKVKLKNVNAMYEDETRNLSLFLADRRKGVPVLIKGINRGESSAQPAAS